MEKFDMVSRSLALQDLVFEKFLGEGSFGSVSLFKNKIPRCNGKTYYVALKTSDRKHADALFKEFKILKEFKGCSRIVQCYGNSVEEIYDLDNGFVKYEFYMEYAPGGSLRSFMDGFKDKILSEPMMIIEFTRMLLEGLATIHEHGYVHCDLKPENILVFPICVDQNGARKTSYELKISDFGLTRKEGDYKWWDPSKPYAGTPIYMSPESISHGETRKELDLWSLGCVVLEMYTGMKPWWHTNFDLEDLMDRYEPLIPDDLPCDAKLFLMTCFAFDPDERKDALTLLRHSFLRGDHVNNKLTKLETKVKIDYPNEADVEMEKKMRQLVSDLGL